MTPDQINIPLTVAEVKTLFAGLTDADVVVFQIFPMGLERCIEVSAGGKSIYVFQKVPAIG